MNLDIHRSLLCSDQARLNSRLICFASCAVISLLLHSTDVRFFEMCVSVYMFVVLSFFFYQLYQRCDHCSECVVPLHASLLYLMLWMCSVYQCVPLSSIQGGEKMV